MTTDNGQRTNSATLPQDQQINYNSLADHSCATIPGGRVAMPSSDSIPLRRIDHVRFFVGNARQSAYFYRNAFGFDVIAYAGLETRQKDEAGYVLRQGNISFVLTSPLSSAHADNRRLAQHGDGVMDIAIEV